MLICIGLGTIGVIKSNELFSSKKNELKFLVDKFNENSLLKTYRLSDIYVSAKLKGKDIIISYEGATKNKYKFELYSGYIETTYSKNDAFASVMVKLLADTISQYYNNVPQAIYKAFENSSELLSYELEDGIKYIDNGTSYTVRLNLNKPIAAKYEEHAPIVLPDNEEETEPTESEETTDVIDDALEGFSGFFRNISQRENTSN